jgi:hypothetical protein
VFVAGGLQGASITGQDKLHLQMPHAAQQGIDQYLLVIGLDNQQIGQNSQFIAAKVSGSPPIQCPAQLRF